MARAGDRVLCRKFTTACHQNSRFTLRSAAMESGIPLYESAIKSGTNSALTWNRLGYCYHNVGQIDVAIKDYQASLDNKPAGFLEQVVQSRLARAYSL